MLRIGEVTLGPHAILARNVNVGINKKKLLFVLNSSKTHGKGQNPQMVKITSQPKEKCHRSQKIHNLCPFTLINNYLVARPHAVSEFEQFFVYSDRSAITPEQARKTLRFLIKRMGLNSMLYNFHSFRIGRCGDLLKYRVSVETIKKLGRWKSNAVFAYLKE